MEFARRLLELARGGEVTLDLLLGDGQAERAGADASAKKTA